MALTSKSPALMKEESNRAMWFSTKLGLVLARCRSMNLPSAATKLSTNRQLSCISDGSVDNLKAYFKIL